jgi:O-antigen/teichoic acid export membrane protein
VFPFIALSNTLGALSKLAFGILFVWLGFSIGRALWGFFMGFLIPYLLSFIPLRFLLKKGVTTPHISFKTLLGYGAPAAAASFGLSGFINTDIILVKHFFDPNLAGLYATLSLIGRVIFFFSAPIGTVMFPLITHRHERKENFHRIFWLSLILVFLCSVVITFFYFLFPEFTIRIFSKDASALVLVPYLGIFAIFIVIYSVLTILNNFYLSINKTKIFIPILVAAFLQGIFIWFYHANFSQVIFISLTIAGLLLLLLLLYYWKLYKQGYGNKEESKI